MKKLRVKLKPAKPDLFLQPVSLTVDSFSETAPIIKEWEDYCRVINITLAMMIDVCSEEVAQQRDKLLHSLTAREKEVAQYIKQELSTKMIADKLKIKVGTILGYRDGLYKKLKVDNMVALLAILDKIM